MRQGVYTDIHDHKLIELIFCVKFLWLYPSDERLWLLFHSEFQNLLVTSGVWARSLPSWRHLELSELDFRWMLAEVLLLDPDLSTLALKQVEMSHLATFKLLLKLF